MTVYAKCHAPTVGWLTDGREYAVQPAPDGCFCITSDAGGKYQTWWADDCFARWERIEQDETGETMLTECKHTTEAKWHDPENAETVRIDVDPEGDITIKAPNRQPVYISGAAFKAITEAVARHDAANGIVKGETQ